MRLIDADVLIDKLEDWRGDKEDLDTEDGHDVAYYSAMSRAMRFVKFSPTIDAVPVVRCKDCQYAIPLDGYAFRRWGNNALNCTECRGDDGFGMAGVSLAYHDGFCDRGVRRDGEPHD